jgi:hypothetical protein
MNITLGFWEKGNAKLTRSYLITAEVSPVDIFGEKFIARIKPAVSNFPPGMTFDPIFGDSEITAKDKAISEIRNRPENRGLRSFEKKA